MGPLKRAYNKQPITLTMVTLNGLHCMCFGFISNEIVITIFIFCEAFLDHYQDSTKTF